MLIDVNVKPDSYRVRIGEGIESFPARIGEYTDSKDIVVVTDSNVASLYASRLSAAAVKEGLSVAVFEIPAGEESKTLSWTDKIYSFLLEKGAERRTPVVALGGGVTGDLAGFAASTFMRGLPFFNVPTSLIAQADSAVGGKTGVNLKQGKNLVGTFYQPHYVHIDVDLLKTLSEKEFKSGLAEVVKHAVIAGPGFFNFLTENAPGIISRNPETMEIAICECVKIKGGIVERDERESGLRKVLNLGHTLGHALEAEAGYGKMTHGEGVSVGMVLAAEISEEMGLSAKGLADSIRRILGIFSLPSVLPAGADTLKLVERMYFDKKVRKRKLEFVIPEELGKVKVGVPVEEKVLEQALNEISS